MVDHIEAPGRSAEDDLLLQRALDRINKELTVTDEEHINGVALNAAFRNYYRILDASEMPDIFLSYYSATHSKTDQLPTTRTSFIIYNILLTANKRLLDPSRISELCMSALIVAINNSDSSCVILLKSANLIFKKWPDIAKTGTAMQMDLGHIYFCLQSNQTGMRDEMLLLLKHVCASREQAKRIFTHIVHFWPWSIRNKLYVISCILKTHSLAELLAAANGSKEEFFNGLRSTLTCKSLLAPSQHVVRALAGQRSQGLLNVCIDVLKHGSALETRNFYTQWFTQIEPKDLLFEKVRDWFLSTSSNLYCDSHLEGIESYRLLTALNMFSKELLRDQPAHMEIWTTAMSERCFRHELDTQLLFFIFVVDNLAEFSLGYWLKFLNTFIAKHMDVPRSDFRNTWLGRIPVVISHLAKQFSKSGEESIESSCLRASILNFFKEMDEEIRRGLRSPVYQPQVTSLKLLDTLLKSLFLTSTTRSSKACCISQNQQLALSLKEHNLYVVADLNHLLLQLLDDPCGFDDAQLLATSIIKQIQTDPDTLPSAFAKSSALSAHSDVDKSNLSQLYARVGVQSCATDSVVVEFFHSTLRDLKTRHSTLREDPLHACQVNGAHLFSPITILNEIVQHRPHTCADSFVDVMQCIEDIEFTVLKILNSSRSVAQDENVAASFEEMEKSLLSVVSRSRYSGLSPTNSCKYLLMSFWLTLKACCDLSSTMASYITATNDGVDCPLLERSLQICVKVLTQCRHKGAIEAAGLAIGKITKCITKRYPVSSRAYDMFHDCVLKLSVTGSSNFSTTRRGAGLSIMFLHIMKNEGCPRRPLLRSAMEILLMTAETNISCQGSSSQNVDRLETLHLHFLCVLVRDTELRASMAVYYNDIMMLAIKHIDNCDWSICNAALQLFGALVPKIVGQRQSVEDGDQTEWQPSEATFCVIERKLKEPLEHILDHCVSGQGSTRSIVLFLEFLCSLDYFNLNIHPKSSLMQRFREMSWWLLSHRCESVRTLASKCFVRAHEFRFELPAALKSIANIIFSVRNENFFSGLIHTLYEGILKFQHESKCITPTHIQLQDIQEIKDILEQTFHIRRHHSAFSLCKLLEVLHLMHFTSNSEIIRSLEQIPLVGNETDLIARDLWLRHLSSARVSEY